MNKSTNNCSPFRKRYTSVFHTVFQFVFSSFISFCFDDLYTSCKDLPNFHFYSYLLSHALNDLHNEGFMNIICCFGVL